MKMAEQVADHVSTRIEWKLAQLPEAPSEPYIFKVDNPLRKENEQAYEPESLSIGPYHHGKDNLKVMEEHKWRYLKQLLQRRQETSVDKYIVALRDLEERARKCYAETISFDKDKFVEIMLLDGCFIIELFRKYQKRELREKPDLIFQLNRVRYKLRRDLMLFENQLPLFILVQLFEMTEPSNSQDNIIDLALRFLIVMLPAGSNALESSTRISIEDDHKETHCHLLSLVHDSWCSKFSIMVSHRNVVPMKEELRFIKSTTELLDTGIKFKKAKKNKILLDIEYNNGVLIVPPMTIDDNTEFIFRNLIAYEQYRHWGTGPKCVSDYCVFMDCLINSPKDAQELRHCGIIDNWLCEDKLVSTMFTKFGNNISISPSEFSYSQIFNKVNKHCRHPWNMWLANLRRDYFNGPWAIISFLAAFVLLLLTFTQTLFLSFPFFQ